MTPSSDPSPLNESLLDVQAVRFVQSLPLDLPEVEVLEQLQSQGHQLTAEQVQTIRSRERARAQARARALNPPTEEDSMEDSLHEPGVLGETPKNQPRRGRKPGGTDTQAGFVRSLPLDLPVKQVVEQARAHGFEVSEGYVYAIRSKLKPTRKTPEPVQKGSTKALAKGLVGRAKGKRTSPAPVVATGSTFESKPAPKALFTRPSDVSLQQVELELARLILEVGVVRADQVLQQLKERLTTFLHPVV